MSQVLFQYQPGARPGKNLIPSPWEDDKSWGLNMLVDFFQDYFSTRVQFLPFSPHLVAWAPIISHIPDWDSELTPRIAHAHSFKTLADVLMATSWISARQVIALRLPYDHHDQVTCQKWIRQDQLNRQLFMAAKEFILLCSTADTNMVSWCLHCWPPVWSVLLI